MCRNCTRHAINTRDPKTLLSAVEVKNQMDFLTRHKNKLKDELRSLEETIHDLRKKCPHLNVNTYYGYDSDTDECKDCGETW